MSNKIINLDALKKFRQECDERYAKPNGNYPTLTSGLADNLTPYSEDSGASQENPFISNGTGTNNNTEIVTVGDYGLLNEKQANTLVANQLAYDLSSTNYSSESDNRTFNTNNNSSTIIINANGEYAQQVGRLFSTGGKLLNLINGHKYLVALSISCSKNISFGNLSLRAATDYVITNVGNLTANTFKFVCGIITSTSNFNSRFGIVKETYFTSDYNNETLTYENLVIIDLTKMFNGNIPQDLLDNPSHFSWYYDGDLSYNTGTLENSNGVKLVSTGRQLWDEVWEQGTIIFTTGQNSSDNTIIRSKNYIKCISNTTYYAYCGTSATFDIFFYDKNKNFISAASDIQNNNFNTPRNCSYIKFRFGSSQNPQTTYNHDITISLYYTPAQGGESYDKYYPYEQPYVVDTGNEVLRSAGNVKDYKEHNRTIHRLVASYTFTGNETWNDYGSSGEKVSSISSILSKVVDQAIVPNVLCSFLQPVSINGAYYGIENGICVTGSNVYVNANQVSSLTGKTIYYELATPTTEQGTPFAENLPINDYGMLYWLDENDNLVGIPQGAKIFYPTNYKGFIDDMYSRVDGDSSAYVVQEELSSEETARSNQDTILQNAIGGTLRQCLCVKESLNFNNTAFVDMGTLTFDWSNSSSAWRAQVVANNIAPHTLKMLSTKYNIYNSIGGNPRVDMTIWRISTTNEFIYINDSNLTSSMTPTQVKDYMKGVLLAYEKA